MSLTLNFTGRARFLPMAEQADYTLIVAVECILSDLPPMHAMLDTAAQWFSVGRAAWSVSALPSMPGSMRNCFTSVRNEDQRDREMARVLFEKSLAAALRAPGGASSPPAAPEQPMGAARAALGEEAFAAAWAEGQSMSPEEACAYALQEPTDA